MQHHTYARVKIRDLRLRRYITCTSLPGLVPALVVDTPLRSYKDSIAIARTLLQRLLLAIQDAIPSVLGFRPTSAVVQRMESLHIISLHKPPVPCLSVCPLPRRLRAQFQAQLHRR